MVPYKKQSKIKKSLRTQSQKSLTQTLSGFYSLISFSVRLLGFAFVFICLFGIVVQYLLYQYSIPL